MTPDTVCLIASNTKLFTAVATGILVDQGKLSFETKIKDLIPGFKVENEHTTEHATVADAMSHSTGCARLVETLTITSNNPFVLMIRLPG